MREWRRVKNAHCKFNNSSGYDIALIGSGSLLIIALMPGVIHRPQAQMAVKREAGNAAGRRWTSSCNASGLLPIWWETVNGFVPRHKLSGDIAKARFRPAWSAFSD